MQKWINYLIKNINIYLKSPHTQSYCSRQQFTVKLIFMSSYFQKKILNGIKIYNLVPAFKRFIFCTDFSFSILIFLFVWFCIDRVYFILLYFCNFIMLKKLKFLKISTNIYLLF